jgi:hypothetical protein
MTNEQITALRSLETAVRIRRPGGRQELIEMAAKEVVRQFRRIVSTYPATLSEPEMDPDDESHQQPPKPVDYGVDWDRDHRAEVLPDV